MSLWILGAGTAQEIRHSGPWLEFCILRSDMEPPPPPRLSVLTTADNPQCHSKENTSLSIWPQPILQRGKLRPTSSKNCPTMSQRQGGP